MAAARLAAAQHGVLSIDELMRAGLSEPGIRRRVAAGRLHRVHRGVYAVGHAGLSARGRWIAAVKACGPGAALSHRSAAELWQMLPHTAGPVHVTVPGLGGRRGREGLRIHRSSSLTRGTTTIRDRISVTTPARTLSDIKRAGDRAMFRRALRQAEFLAFPLEDAGDESDHTRSELERAFLRVCRRYHLPAPEVNVRIGAFTVDFLWRAEHLVVEVDGYGSHRGRQAFEDDRARDVELRLLGYEVLRFTYRQVLDDPAGTARAVRALLSRGQAQNRRYSTVSRHPLP